MSKSGLKLWPARLPKIHHESLNSTNSNHQHGINSRNIKKCGRLSKPHIATRIEKMKNAADVQATLEICLRPSPLRSSVFLAGALSPPFLLNSFVITLRQRVEDGQDEEDDHRQHELLENPTQQTRILKKIGHN